MIRRLAIAAALSTASLVAFLPAASAQTYGGVTLSFGSPGYHDRYDRYDRRYEEPRYNGYYDQDEAWEARRRWEQHERWEQRERWEQERARQEYWRRKHAEHRRWHRDDDDD